MSENSAGGTSPITILFKVIMTFIKAFIGLIFGTAFTAVSCMFAYDALSYIAAFAGSGVMPYAFIAQHICLALAAFGIAGLVWRFVFSKKLAAVRYSTIALCTLAFFVGAAAFSIADSAVTDDFRWAEYPGYIEQWQTDILTQTVSCDYSAGQLNFEGYLPFITDGFRENRKIVVAEDSSLTDAYNIEVHYKGAPSELYIYSADDYESISVWNIDYDYELTAGDYVYMYKNKENLEYAQPLAIEKIVIRTAYPNLINTDKLESY